MLGFTLSIILTLAAYHIVSREHLSDGALFYTLIGLALSQVIFQLIFFLHIGLESKPHWGIITLLFMVLVVVIVVGGTIWIMHNLDYNVMMGM